jgi:peroxiredoxin family protein
MSADAPADPDGDATSDHRRGDGEAAARVETLRAEVDRLREEVADLRAADDGPKRMTIIATKGSLDMAYPPLILASTAAAFGWDVVVFFTFWGLDVLHEEKSRNLKLSAVGNPNVPVPNAVAALPFMDSVATRLMERRIADNGTATVSELIDVSLETGVDLQACEMTADLMAYDDDAFHDGVTTGVGAATALRHMADADVQLLV